MPDKTRISVVDNEPAILEIVKCIFNDYSEYRFKYFLKGSDFIKDLDNRQYLDLAVLDVHVEPWFDVIDAIQKLEELFPMAYIIVLSGDTDPRKLMQFIKMGIFDFIEKGTKTFKDDLENSVKRAHRKITIRKGLLEDGIQ